MNTALKSNGIQFADNPAALKEPDKYMRVDIDVAAVLDSWKTSLFAFEWMGQDGTIKPLDELPLSQHQKRLDVETELEKGAALTMPVLGFGMLGSVEIGSGKAVLLTLAAHGHQTVPVHIRKADEQDFAAYITK